MTHLEPDATDASDEPVELLTPGYLAALHVMSQHWMRGLHMTKVSLPYPRDPVAEAVLLARWQAAQKCRHDTAELLLMVRH